MSISLRLDYATFNFDAGSVDLGECADTLAPGVDFCWRRKGLSDNAPHVSPLGVTWFGNSGWKERPHMLQVSGVGCEKLMLTLPLLREIVGADHCHFSRLDFAFDVVMPKPAWRDFLKRAFISSLESERERKRYALTGDGEAMTVYIGNRKSSKYFRVYNKTLEDGCFKLEDDNGEFVSVDTEQYVIRYELELKRVASWLRGQKQVFDPSPLFDAYYSDDELAHDWLIEEVRKMWLSYGNDILLPDGFADADISLRVLNKTKNFVQHAEVEQRPFDPVVQTVADVHDFPHVFNRTISWMVSKLGKYIPWIVADGQLYSECEKFCKRDFGVVPEFVVESRILWDRDFEELDEDTQLPWSPWGDENLNQFQQGTCWDDLDFC